VIPHITDEIKSKVLDLGQDVDIVIVEVGGTVGDIERSSFFRGDPSNSRRCGRENSLYIHLTLVPYIGTAGEAEDQTYST